MRKRFVLILLAVSVFGACAGSGKTEQVPASPVQAAAQAAGASAGQEASLVSPILSNPSLASTRSYWPTEEWRTARPADIGMDEKPLADLAGRIEGDNILAMLVVKGGFIVAERYKTGYDSTSLFSIFSCTKSVTSALLGIALDKGLIGGIDLPVSEFYPGVATTQDGAQKVRITVRDLLSMTSGLDWPEWQAWNYGIDPMVRVSNWIEFVLSRPLASTPGTAFNYNTGGSQILSGIIGMRAGMPAARFAEEELFSRIGIGRENGGSGTPQPGWGHVVWPTDPQGVSYGGFGIMASARDAARFGFLFLNNGVWDGVQIVSKRWVEESTREQSGGHPWFGRYGLHWWVASLSDERARSMFFAMGYAGQYIFVIPALDVVAVFMSDMPGESCFKPMRYLEQYIVPAVMD
jgi:CubicO group peptidase (beta-lactamase class C family)